jgi:hypothetical protein
VPGGPRSHDLPTPRLGAFESNTGAPRPLKKKEEAMLLLMLDRHDVHLSPESCRHILEQLPNAETHAFYYHLDDSRPKKPKARYRRPFFKFYYRGKGYEVARTRLGRLRLALEESVNHDVKFQIGFRPISATPGATRMLP